MTQDCKDEVYKIRDIAKLFRQSYKLVEEIKQKQALIQKHKQSTLEKDEEAMRWKTRAQALKDRIEINQSYLKLLNETQGKIAPKIASYSGTANSAEGLRKEFESIQQWSPTITLDQDHKSNCQCRIF